MRRVALTLTLAVLTAVPALADGETVSKSQDLRPASQSNVVVSIERGVRVWRPVTAAYAAINSDEGYAPDASYGTSYAPDTGSYGLGSGYGYGYGWGLPYGYGSSNGYGRKHERNNGMNPFIARHPALARFHRDHRGPVIVPDRIRILGHGHPRGPMHPPVTIHVNIGPAPHAAPHGVRGHGGGPGKLAWTGPRGPAPMGGHFGGHPLARAGGHRGGHR